MIATLKTTDPGPAPEDQHTDRPRKRHDPEDRLHVSALLFGLIDARASHVDFLDTSGGQELQRWYHRHHPGRRHVGH
ncbi:MAG TPA: hypothetical protein VFZ64_13830 [Nocardioidaceae bacterium]